MTDLHTHILPGMDDGAHDAATGLQMLRMEREQGIDLVALTPHFYSDRESAAAFLRRRAAAQARLEEAISTAPDASALPRRILGAEVAWTPYLDRMERLDELCYAGSSYLLLELPFAVWNSDMFRTLYTLMERTGVTPVIAHIDRYWGLVDRAQMAELLSMGLPVQLSAAALTNLRTRFAALRLLRQGKAQLLISDAHGDRQRPPNIGAAMNVLRRRDPALHNAIAGFRMTEDF